MNPSTALPTPPAAKASPLINRNFALLFGGVAISYLGDMIFNITLILWVTQTLAHGQPWAPLAVSGVLVAAALPILLVGPLAGVFVDRWDKRRTMLAMDALRAVLVALLAPLAASAFALPFWPGGRLPLAWQLGTVYAVVFLATCCTQFFSPARMALIGDIVPEERRTQASGLLQTTMGLSFVIGPALAAPLFFAAGATWALTINALSFAGSFLALLVIRPPALLAPPAGARRSSVLGELGAGIGFFARSRVLMTLLVTGVIVMLGGGALNALDVFFVTRNLHTPLSAYGALEAVFGAGALLGALLLSIFARRIGAARTLWASILGIGLLMMVYARLTALTPALVVLFFVGVLNAGINIALGPIVLHVTPRALVGRVMAVLLPVMTLAQVLSIALAGYLASTVLADFHVIVLGQPLGPIDTIFLIAGALAAAGGLYAMGSLRGLRLTGEPGARATPTDHAPDAAEEAEEPEEPAPAPSPLVAR